MTQIAGILNITPDSFSGDGALPVKEIAARIRAMIAEGVDIIDIGAESTRPGATKLSWEEEWQRFDPVMDCVTSYADKVKWSVDTRHSETAVQFIRSFPTACHKHIYINDVSGGRDEKLVEAARSYGTKLVLTHSLVIPADKAVTLPPESDVMAILCEWGRQVIYEYGNEIILDPGIGFGKTSRQSWEIIKNINQLKNIGAPVMVGHSRKSFLELFTAKQPQERDKETLLVSYYLAEKKVDYLRVHDVASHVTMLTVRKKLCSTPILK